MNGDLVVLPPKSPLATIASQWDFSSLLTQGQSISGVITTATVWTGADTNPAGIFGSGTISGLIYILPLTGGVTGTIYKITATATASDGQHVTLIGYLAIVADPL